MMLGSIGLMVLLSACSPIDRLGGASSEKPEDLKLSLSKEASDLVKRAYQGLDPAALVDFHTHVVGINSNGSGTYVHPKMLSWAHPTHKIKGLVYMSGAGVTDLEQADEQYLDRLLRLIRSQPEVGRYRLLAFDHHYNRDGSISEDESEFYVPNEYVVELARTYPDIFLPTISVHPWRKDALDELHRWGRQGVRYIKWLPNAMGMDAADPEILPYYEVMKEYGMVLLTHVGEEQAVEAEEDQELGNPLLFRVPLDLGVKVIMAHLGSLGSNTDLDNPENGRVPSYQLVMRLMDDPRYKELLFGELSATMQFNRIPKPLNAFLQRMDLHDRLVNGSDYPLPAINVVIRTRDLQRHGFITAEERDSLNEIYEYNPLLFDFVLKRTVRLPGTSVGFPPTLFEQHPDLPLGNLEPIS